MWWVLCPLTVLFLSLYTAEPVDIDALLLRAGEVDGDAGQHLSKTCGEVVRRRGHPRIGLLYWVQKLRIELDVFKK